MTSDLKNIASPFSTSGGGFFFESNVLASFGRFDAYKWIFSLLKEIPNYQNYHTSKV